jgi:hypothetical protein
LDDVGVLQAGGRLDLAAEALPLLGAGVRAAQDHLERHRPVQVEVPGQPDDAHAAAAQLAQDRVAGDGGRARGRGHDLGDLEARLGGGAGGGVEPGCRRNAVARRRRLGGRHCYQGLHAPPQFRG